MPPALPTWAAPAGRRRPDPGGFSLVEIMVALVIFGILSTMAMSTFLTAKERAREKAAEQTVVTSLRAAQSTMDEGEAPTLPDLQASEPELQFTTGESTGPDVVSVASGEPEGSRLVVGGPGRSLAAQVGGDDAVSVAVLASPGGSRCYYGRLTVDGMNFYGIAELDGEACEAIDAPVVATATSFLDAEPDELSELVPKKPKKDKRDKKDKDKEKDKDKSSKDARDGSEDDDDD